MKGYKKKFKKYRRRRSFKRNGIKKMVNRYRAKRFNRKVGRYIGKMAEKKCFNWGDGVSATICTTNPYHENLAAHFLPTTGTTLNGSRTGN